MPFVEGIYFINGKLYYFFAALAAVASSCFN